MGAGHNQEAFKYFRQYVDLADSKGIKNPRRKPEAGSNDQFSSDTVFE